MKMRADGVDTVSVCGLRFASGEVEVLKNAALEMRGLVTAPSAPCLTLAAKDARYAADLSASVLVIPDSGAMVLMWRLAGGGALRRVSGLAFLQAILGDERVRQPNALFLVDPSEEESRRNREFLATMGISLKSSHQYVAPAYPRGDVRDERLLQVLRRVSPRYVLINLGGGVQERLGAWLQANWNREGEGGGIPTLICTGAAIAFLTGKQVRIPAWADRLYLGWAVRCFSRPDLYVPRYFGSAPVLYQTWCSARAARREGTPSS